MTDRPPHVPVQAPLQQLPAGLGAAADYARLAPRFIAEPLLAHLDGGAGHDRSAAANLAAFGRWQVMPRLLRDLRHGHTRCRPAGLDLPHPLLLAAVARLGEYAVDFTVAPDLVGRRRHAAGTRATAGTDVEDWWAVALGLQTALLVVADRKSVV